MRNFQDKRGSKNIWQSKPVAVVLGIVVLVFAFNIFGLWGKMQETERNKKAAEEKVVELEQQKAKLSSDIDKLKTDQGVEAEIRDKFGLVKPGEGMIVIVDDKSDQTATPVSQSNGFISFFKNLFK